VYQNGVLITGTETDFDGYFAIKDLPIGVYELEFSYVGYKTLREDCILKPSDYSNVDVIYEIEKSIYMTGDFIVVHKDPPHGYCPLISIVSESVSDEETAADEDVSPRENSIDDPNDILIFPNPASDYIHVKVDENVQVISILNTSGQLLASVRNTFTELISFAINELVSGAYYLRFLIKDGSVRIEKFVVR